MVHRSRGLFDLNSWTRAMNVFKEDSLGKRLPPHQVTEEF